MISRSPSKRPRPLERFRRLYEIQPDDCWNFSKSLNPKGYASFWMGTRQVPAHRASWMLHVGQIPDGKHVLHRCDNRRCVNPAHLFLGTNQDNVDDRQAKGRGFSPANVRHLVRSKLDPTKVREIRAAMSRGVTRSALAAEYSVSVSNIDLIATRLAWGRVE